MTAIKIRTHLESDTIRIPELEPMIGKDVEINVEVSVIEEAAIRQGDLREFFEAAKNPPVDLDAVMEMREISKT